MQLFGTGTGQIDRVEIPLTPNRTIDVGGDFDEGSGTVLIDATGGNNGVVQVGGNPSGPVWSADRPF
jgi:hypothetical protein